MREDAGARLCPTIIIIPGLLVLRRLRAALLKHTNRNISELKVIYVLMLAVSPGRANVLFFV